MGKTSIASRFVDDRYSTAYKQTIGLDFFLREVTLRERTKCALQLWDIGGQKIGGKMINNYIYGAKAIVLCYDITSNEVRQRSLHLRHRHRINKNCNPR